MNPPGVQVSGMGCVCAAGSGVRRCMDSLFSGERCFGPPRRFSTPLGDEYGLFQAPDSVFADPSPNKEISDTVRLLRHAAAEALDQAGMDQAGFANLRVGVCIGTSVGASLDFFNTYAAFRGKESSNMAEVRRYLENNPALALARELGLSGPCQTVANACSSGTDAIGIGASWIKTGLCDMVLAGGADAINAVTFTGFIRMLITSGDPCKPFDRDRSGLNLGDGAAVLVLERSGFRSGPARGYVLGYGTAGDAHHLTAPSPDGLGLKLALRQALAISSTAPEDITFVNAHGTATRANDTVESKVLAEVFPQALVSATKGYTGHTLGAAGALEAVFSLACLEAGRIPGSAGFETPDPELDTTPVRTAESFQGRYALSQSLAFGGNNSALVLAHPEVFA